MKGAERNGERGLSMRRGLKPEMGRSGVSLKGAKAKGQTEKVSKGALVFRKKERINKNGRDKCPGLL